MTLTLKAERWHFAALDKHAENHEKGSDLKEKPSSQNPQPSATRFNNS